MHDVAAGITAGREKTKPRGLSVVRGGRGVAVRTVALLGTISSTPCARDAGPTTPSNSLKAGESNG